MLSAIALKLIRGYQLTLRHLLGSSCRFSPSCSDYALEAIGKRGFFKGCLMAGKRLLSCHPFSGKSGDDQVE